MVKQSHDDLGRRLTALRADFAALGSRAAGAASALVAKLPPSPDLLDDLTAAREAFTDLRNAVLQHAGALSLVLDVERLGSLRDLEPVLAAIGVAEHRRSKVAEWEKSCEGALVLLDRVMLLTHREERSFGPLAECQARARALRGVLTGTPPADPEREAATIPDKLRPFTELLALIEGWNTLDDDHCARLQDTIAATFGRPLALAALRGKLGREGELVAPAPERVPELLPERMSERPPARVPEPPSRARGPAEDAYATYSPSAYAPPAPPSPPPARPPVGAPSGGARTYADAVQAEPPAAPVANSGVMPAIGAPFIPADGAGRRVAGTPAASGGAAPAETSAVVEIRLSSDKISVETPEKQREREALLERLAHEAAPWWIAAREGWKAMGSRGVTFADASRDYVKRFPYLLSVPLQKSADTQSGKVAEGYALLLAHIEKQEANFVRDALTRLNPQFTTAGKEQSYQMGQELYLYIVAEGRLYKTYPDFVKDVVVNALPEPGPWVQGRLIESDSETSIVTRGEKLGSTQEQTHTMTNWKERTGPHLFTVTSGPLTSRFFTVTLGGATLADPPDVEVKLKENDAATDHAWLVTLPVTGRAEPLAPRKHRAGGTTLPGFGKEFGMLWIGIYNADPSSERSYELAVTLRRKPPGSISPGKFFGKRG